MNIKLIYKLEDDDDIFHEHIYDPILTENAEEYFKNPKPLRADEEERAALLIQ